jgi:hypothetical protein
MYTFLEGLRDANNFGLFEFEGGDRVLRVFFSIC